VAATQSVSVVIVSKLLCGGVNVRALLPVTESVTVCWACHCAPTINKI